MSLCARVCARRVERCGEQNLLSPLSATDSVANVRNQNGTKKNLTEISYTSKSFSDVRLLCRSDRVTNDFNVPLMFVATGGSLHPPVETQEWQGISASQTPSLLACVSTTLSTGMKADVSLKLLLLTMWVWMLRLSA